MSSDRDTTRIVRSWLDEGVTQLPDRVLDAVLDQVPTTPQRQAGWLARRFPIMNNASIRYGVAAVAVIAAVILGLNVLPGGVGGPPAPTPTPTPIPSPSPSAEPASIPWGSLEAGRYAFDNELGITIEAPAGWAGCCEGGLILNGDAVPDFAAIGYWDVTDIIVYDDPCAWSDSTVTEPRGAEAIAAALAAQPEREGTAPTEVSVAGARALHVRLTVPADLETTPQSDGDANFVDCDQLEYRTWNTATDATRYQQAPGQIDDLYIIDLAGHTVVFDLTYFEETSEPDRAALEAMLASIRID
jgi:hypothetical protein